MKPCKDLETARSLISQMKGEVAGRKPSTYRDAQSPKYDVPEVGKKWFKPRVQGPMVQEVQSSTPPGGFVIYRDRLEDCEVEDMVPVELTPFQSGNWVRVQIHYDGVTCNESSEERLFKRITHHTNLNHGCGVPDWRTTHYWKRTA